MKQQLWCCVDNSKSDYYLPSLAHRKSDSIAMFLKDTSLSWNYFKGTGWKCIKVEVTIKPI